MNRNYILIDDSIERVTIPDFFDRIAYIAHNCYQVETKEHDKNIAFIMRLINNGHLAMMEHYRFVIKVDKEYYDEVFSIGDPFLTLKKIDDDYYISYSVRPLIEHRDDKRYYKLILSLPVDVKKEIFSIDDPALYPLIDDLKDGDELFYYTYHLITDRGVTHEVVRHRLCSFAQESTRYCNYTKNKFSNSLTFIKPLDYEEKKAIYDNYYHVCTETYFDLVESGSAPEIARSVLPNSLKASIMVTCSLKEWKYIFDLRTSTHAHPDIRRVMNKVRDDMSKRGLI